MRNYNIPLFRKMIERVEAEHAANQPQAPSFETILGDRYGTWEQGVWATAAVEGVAAESYQDTGLHEVVSCPTTMCMAGHVAHIEGAALLVGKEELLRAEEEGHPALVDWVKTKDGKVEDIEDFAANALGLGSEEAWALFYMPTKDPQVIRAYAESIVGELL